MVVAGAEECVEREGLVECLIFNSELVRQCRHGLQTRAVGKRPEPEPCRLFSKNDIGQAVAIGEGVDGQLVGRTRQDDGLQSVAVLELVAHHSEVLLTLALLIDEIGVGEVDVIQGGI